MNRLTRCLDTNNSSSSDSEDGTPQPIATKHLVGFDPHVSRLLVNRYTAGPRDAPPSPTLVPRDTKEGAAAVVSMATQNPNVNS